MKMTQVKFTSHENGKATRVFLPLLLAAAAAASEEEEGEEGNFTKGEGYKVENFETVDGVVEEIEDEGGGEMFVRVEHSSKSQYRVT
ncbi:hypothetical protein CsSME_00014974 [Camellia sinensis var. sinensis]